MTSVWDFVLGQDRAVQHLRRAVQQPVHAYLFVGPEGCGSAEAARAFAGVLLSNSDDSSDRINDMAWRGTHPDIHEVFDRRAHRRNDSLRAIRLVRMNVLV